MQIASDSIEKRRRFTFEERTAILKRTHGICACCGKKLTTKTMTIDHIIPISRGGTNDPENLIALCEADNKAKGNILYVPKCFYAAFSHTAEMERLQQHFIKWFDTVKDQFDIARFPLIAPHTRLRVEFSDKVPAKRRIFNPQLLLQWSIINQETYDEIEAVTGLSLRDIRTQLASGMAHINKKEHATPIVALYALRKLSNAKIIAVVAIQVCPEEKHVSFMLPWADCSSHGKPVILRNFVPLALDILLDIAKCQIQSYVLITPEKAYLDYFVNNQEVSSCLGSRYRLGCYKDMDTDEINTWILEGDRRPAIENIRPRE